MTFNRDFYSRGVSEALAQDCRDMRSDDAVTTAERLRQPFKQQMRAQYETQFRRRVAEDPANRLLNNAFRQQYDIGTGDRAGTPLIANLCAGMYYSDARPDGTREQYRELLKPHGLASRGPSRLSGYNRTVIDSEYQPQSQQSQQSQQQQQQQQQQQRQSGRASEVSIPPPCHCPATATTTTTAATSVVAESAAATTAAAQQQQAQQVDDAAALARIAQTATADPKPRPSSAGGGARPHSRLGMTFPLRQRPNVAPNPIALLEARRAIAEQEHAAANPPPPPVRPASASLRAGFPQQRPASAAAPYVSQQQQRRNSAVNSARSSTAAAPAPELAVVGQAPAAATAAAAAAAAAPTPSGSNSKINTGRSTHSVPLNPAVADVRPRGEISYGKRTDVAKYHDAAAAAEEERSLRAQLPKKAPGPQLVPAVANPNYYPTSIGNKRRSPGATAVTAVTAGAHTAGGVGDGRKDTSGGYGDFPSAQRYADDTYVSRHHQRPQRIAYSPARGSLEQYTQGLFVGGQQVLKPDEVPKIGAIDLNALVNPELARKKHSKSQQQQLSSVPRRPCSAVAAGSRNFFY